jgi:hypothetical protein
MKFYMFRVVPLSIIRSLFTVNSALVRHKILKRAFEEGRDVPPDDGQRDYPKHVEFHAKNKFEKLVHLVGLIT